MLNIKVQKMPIDILNIQNSIRLKQYLLSLQQLQEIT